MHEWNVHREIFSRLQAEENSRQCLLPRTDILQKTVVGCPCFISNVIQESLSISEYQAFRGGGGGGGERRREKRQREINYVEYFKFSYISIGRF